MRLINGAILRVMTWLRRDEGQSLVEYALILALISIAAIVVMGTLSGTIKNVFTNVVSAL